MKKKKVFIIASIVVLTISVLVSAGTYAWYVWSTNDDEKTEIATGVGAATVIYDAGSSMLGQSIRPVSDKTSGIIKYINIKTSKNTLSKISFNLYLDINVLDEGLKHESFKYELYKGSTLVKNGNFSQDYLNNNLVTCSTNNTNHIVLLTNETITTTLSRYTLYVWIDGVNYTNPDTMQNANFSFKLHADGQNAIIEEAKYPDITAVKEGTLSYKIVNDYTTSKKEEITNNGVRYYYDKQHNLMSDVGGNTRYYGANPNNNIYFNCDDYTNQTSDTCELWRIIGVFEDKVKIIRNDSLGNFSWDYDYNDGEGKTTYRNNWHTSSLQTLLNNRYYNNIDTVYYNGSTTGTAVNFNTDKTGLKNDTTRNMIATVNYGLGGWEKSSIYSDQFYKYERGTTVSSGNPTSWLGKIALMHASDYGYATDFTKCISELYYYGNNLCTSNNWLYNKVTRWVLTPGIVGSSSVWLIGSDGSFFGSSSRVTAVYGVCPVLYLNSETSIVSGDGSQTSPYRINQTNS